MNTKNVAVDVLLTKLGRMFVTTSQMQELAFVERNEELKKEIAQINSHIDNAINMLEKA